MTQNSEPRRVSPHFTRGEVAKILNVTPLTISNREKSGKYPKPARDLNNYRVYSLRDVLTLQLLTYKHLDTRPVISVMYDKGYTDIVHLGLLIDQEFSHVAGELPYE